MRLSRPTLGSVPLAALVAAYLLLLTNRTFWAKGLAYFSGHEAQLAALGLGLFLLLLAALTTLSMKYVVKPVLIALILVSAAASHFVDTYGFLIDCDMIANVALTSSAEAGNLMTPGFLLHMALFGLLPACLVALVRVRHRTFWGKFRQNSLVVFPSIAATLAIVLAFYPGFASTFRGHRDLLASLNPSAPLIAAVKYARMRIGERDYVAAPLGLDARAGARPGLLTASARRPVVTVLVVGETARSVEFGLNGYSRDTTPELAGRGVVSFTDVSSCGTSTAVSVPCMFSNLGRANYSDGGARSVENVLDVLTHAGIDVRWIDNDTGAYHVADRVPYAFLPESNDPRFCEGGECHDEILTERLKAELATVTKDTVIVLHQLGSHGPAYHERYPTAFERFAPACRTAEFADCTREEIVNAYDNTILYTDHVLAQAIDALAARPDLESAMLYVSDHGESLGENGLYLHAMPYFLAPSTQTTVPMIAWLSPSFAADRGIDAACLQAGRGASLSHDNLFHSLIGLANVSTAVYDEGLDAFASCRRAPPTGPHVAALPGAAS
ncbi:phosphoethanolamine transferase [Antarcticirhabdus aurantiaca]|uniref:Phosphoethanolamine--lipid A transferase n=1 Tax=Antarcticirhabdus aurantiaca TaxID=2606717 RepID=A0ACD4NRU8_9HYPH|nr:phosphoethanolamine--lipid A transferase [Antarcticirhabdus aurantiaca]WAJ29661.1 phosphoethanolamine--lipid A transferase [Jeongeuplla avenae]